MYTSLSKKQTAISPKALTFYPKNGSINTVMWELRTILPHGRIHLRNLVLIVTSLLVAVFSCNLLLSAPVSAADAVRNGNTITYNNGSFTQTADIAKQVIAANFRSELMFLNSKILKPINARRLLLTQLKIPPRQRAHSTLCMISILASTAILHHLSVLLSSTALQTTLALPPPVPVVDRSQMA